MDKELKKVELEQRLIKKGGIHSCEHELENFLGKNNEVDTRLIEGIMGYSSCGSQREENLVMGLPIES